MMIRLIDRDGDSVKMSKSDIAYSLKKMGNPKGTYTLTNNVNVFGEFDVIMFKAAMIPAYSWFTLLKKRVRWYFKERALVKAWRSVDDIGLVIKERPFKLEKPWLALKGNKPVTIYVN